MNRVARGMAHAHPQASSVYFIRATRTGLIKIGRSVDPDGRLRALQTATQDELEPLGLLLGDHVLERSLHERFGAAHERGEWYRPIPELLAFIECAAEPWLWGTRVGWSDLTWLSLLTHVNQLEVQHLRLGQQIQVLRNILSRRGDASFDETVGETLKRKPTDD